MHACCLFCFGFLNFCHRVNSLGQLGQRTTSTYKLEQIRIDQKSFYQPNSFLFVNGALRCFGHDRIYFSISTSCAKNQSSSGPNMPVDLACTTAAFDRAVCSLETTWQRVFWADMDLFGPFPKLNCGNFGMYIQKCASDCRIHNLDDMITPWSHSNLVGYADAISERFLGSLFKFFGFPLGFLSWRFRPLPVLVLLIFRAFLLLLF